MQFINRTHRLIRPVLFKSIISSAFEINLSLFCVVISAIERTYTHTHTRNKYHAQYALDFLVPKYYSEHVLTALGNSGLSMKHETAMMMIMLMEG